MENFWDYSVWGTLLLVASLLLSLLVGNVLKKNVPFLRNSLVPTSVLGGMILLIVSVIYSAITGENIFNSQIFGGNGISVLEIITYHALAIGFIGQALKISDKKMTKQRSKEIFDSGVTTVSTYLLQAIFGLGITMLIALFMTEFFSAAGILLPFGYGQGTGQALNYGNIYETDYGFVGGKSFGLTIAALGFLSASIGGVIYLGIQKKRGKIKFSQMKDGVLFSQQIEKPEEVPMNGSMDKLTIQIAFIALVYAITYALMYGLGLLLPGMRATIYGFNFLFGVLIAAGFKALMNLFRKKGVVKKQYTNNFLLTRISNFAFDIMIVAGIAAIQMNLLKDYWWILLLLGIVGLVITFIYNLIVAKTLFKDYQNEQFVAMYGMLTGTASTGIMLLREIDGEFKTPAADNLVYQTLPAIVFGFPMMLLATLAPKNPLLTFGILVAFFIVMNLILFRSKIFKKKSSSKEVVANNSENQSVNV